MGTLITLLILAGLVMLIWLLIRQDSLPGPGAEGSGLNRGTQFVIPTGVAGELHGIGTGDVVEYLGRRFVVRGSLYFHAGEGRRSDHFLDDAEGDEVRISVVEEPLPEVHVWHPVQNGKLDPKRQAVTHEGVTFKRVEDGTAHYRSSGATGVGWSGEVEYVRYEAEGGRRLAFERFGEDEWRVGFGAPVTQGEIVRKPPST